MAGVMLVRQKVTSVARRNAVFRDPGLDAAEARTRAGAIGGPDGVWYGPQEVR